jgi:hypothetical protein
MKARIVRQLVCGSVYDPFGNANISRKKSACKPNDAGIYDAKTTFHPLDPFMGAVFNVILHDVQP